MGEVFVVNDLPKDSYSEEEFYADCSSGNKVDMNHLGWKTCISPDSGCRSDITWEIGNTRKHMPSFKKAIQLVITIGKVSGRKGFQAECMFDINDLLDHILEEGDILNRREGCGVAPESGFIETSDISVQIRDIRNKHLVLQESQGRAHLVALFLQGNSSDKEAKINIHAYKSLSSNRQTPITLSILGRDHYLSCITEEGDPDTPVLSLTEVTNIQEKENDDLLPFLFYRRVINHPYNTFESAAFPGWCIATSQAENQFVQIKPQSDQVNIKDFQLQLTS